MSSVVITEQQFQLISDLHTEFYCGDIHIFDFVTPAAPYLIIAGDLGNPFLDSYSSFLEQASKLFVKVFLCAGNHEFYNLSNQSALRSMNQTEQRIREIVAQFTNVIYLQQEAYAFEYPSNLVVLGLTLWSHIPARCEFLIKTSINDYRLIGSNCEAGRAVSVRETNQLHASGVEWLVSMLEDSSYREKRFLIISHHLPSFQLISPHYQGSPLNCAYASDLDNLLARYNDRIEHFCSGHTHSSLNVMVKNVHCIVNPRGYVKEYHGTENYEYDKKCVLRSQVKI